MRHISSLEARILFAGGVIDTSFGTAGTTDVLFKVAAHETAAVQKVVSDSGGRSYVVAISAAASSSPTQSLQIRRLTQAGALDGSWATAKSNNLVFPISEQLRKTVDVALDAADRLNVMVGNQIFRFTTAGTLDASFGRGGTATLAGLTSGASMALDATGQFYVIGTQATTSTQFPTRAAIERLGINGGVDTTFATAGVMQIPLYATPTTTRGGASGADIRVLADGGVLATASANYTAVDDTITYTYTGVEAVKLTAAGAVDTNYGTQHGIATFFARSGDVSFQSSRPLAIRSSGAVVLYYSGGTDDPNGAGSFSKNQQIAANGKSSAAVNLRPATGVLNIGGSQLPAVDFIANGTDGSELTVSPGTNTVGRVVGNTYDTAFNGGSEIASVSTASLQRDGSVVTAFHGSVRNRVTLKRIYRDDAPVAQINAKPLTAATTYKFSVVYRGPTSVIAGSITGLELRLVGASGQYVRPRLIGTTTLDDGSIVATYKSTNLAGKSFAAADNGAYALRILDGFVQDAGGTFVPKRTLGNLNVAIA